jgi:hypothetical protein
MKLVFYYLFSVVLYYSTANGIYSLNNLSGSHCFNTLLLAATVSKALTPQLSLLFNATLKRFLWEGG